MKDATRVHFPRTRVCQIKTGEYHEQSRRYRGCV